VGEPECVVRTEGTRDCADAELETQYRPEVIRSDRDSSCLRRNAVQELSRRAGQGDSAELDRQIRALIELEDELERRLGLLLRKLNDLSAWRRLCFAGLRHYAEELEDFVDTWDVSEASPGRRSDEVYAREGWRCFAPGCTSRSNLEDHHLKYRSRGGDAKAPSNRTCLCGFHHRRGEHGDLARCRGQAPLGVLWRLGRKEVGVWFRNERRLNANRATRATEQWDVA
jgi:hypothetical protein